MEYSEGLEWIIAQDLSNTIIQKKEHIDFETSFELMVFLKIYCNNPNEAFAYMTQSYNHFEKVLAKTTQLIKLKLKIINEDLGYNTKV